MQRRGGRLVALVVGTSLVAACSGGGGEAEESSEPSSSSATSFATSSGSSGSSAETSAPAVPVMPEEARGDDDAAAVAFVEHWVELVNYAIATGDTEPLVAVTGRACAVCDGMYAELAATGGESASGAWSISESAVRPPSSGDLGPAAAIVEGAIEVDGGRGAAGTLAMGLDRIDNEWSVSWATVDQA